MQILLSQMLAVCYLCGSRAGMLTRIVPFLVFAIATIAELSRAKYRRGPAH